MNLPRFHGHILAETIIGLFKTTLEWSTGSQPPPAQLDRQRPAGGVRGELLRRPARPALS
jgi:hypothetical protein